MNANSSEPKYVHGGKFQLQFPLVSKIRGKKKVWIKNRGSVVENVFEDDDEECTIPLTMAIHDHNNSNGYLLDRIASLEDRILQLCLEIESYKKLSSLGSSCSLIIRDNNNNIKSPPRPSGNTSLMMIRDKFSAAAATGASSSSSGSKIDRMCSYPTFDIPNPQRIPRVSFNDNNNNNNNVVFQGNTKKVQQEGQEIKISSSILKQKQKQQQLLGKKRDRKTTGRNGKKNVSQSWPHLKILGC